MYHWGNDELQQKNQEISHELLCPVREDIQSNKQQDLYKTHKQFGTNADTDMCVKHTVHVCFLQIQFK